MWIFTRYGFFSFVCARQGDGKYGQPVDPDRIMIRARSMEHLECLKGRFVDELDQYDIREFGNSDYPFRIIIKKLIWWKLVTKLAEEVDYDNFKSEVARYLGQSGSDYGEALHQVWEVMRHLEV